MRSSVLTSPHSRTAALSSTDWWVHAKCQWAELPHFNDKRLSGRIHVLDRAVVTFRGQCRECGQNSGVVLRTTSWRPFLCGMGVTYF